MASLSLHRVWPDKQGHLQQRSGFTLIELLVVIAIIAILAAILFPVFARARERARSTTCLSNCKQIGLSVEMYKQDFDGFFPFSRDLVAPNGGNWYYFLGPYIKNQQIELCPDDPANWSIGYSYNTAFGYFPGAETSPSRSGTFSTYCGVAQRVYDGINESVLAHPSTSIVLTEGTLQYDYYRYYAGDTDATAIGAIPFIIPYTGDMGLFYFHPNSDPPSGLHFGGDNSVYADGHAKWQYGQNLVSDAIWCP